MKVPLAIKNMKAAMRMARKPHMSLKAFESNSSICIDIISFFPTQKPASFESGFLLSSTDLSISQDAG